jgi:hypothetical protein
VKANKLPTQDRLKEVLSYDPMTGDFEWIKTLTNAHPAGSRAGCKSAKGYVHIAVDDVRYPASRLAWLYMTGNDPGELEVDHDNRIRSDNRFSNLKLATRKQNNENTNMQKNNTSGYRGVSFTKGRWEAYIYHHRKKIRVGWFRNLVDAALARDAIEKRLFTGILAADSGEARHDKA